MKDCLVVLFAALTVILCLARSGYGATNNDFSDYNKRIPRSANRLDRDTLRRMLTSLERDSRTYLEGKFRDEVSSTF